ncbi:MAG: hypothetical protein V1882_12525 [Candidatus Omnitrophota bacterium]
MTQDELIGRLKRLQDEEEKAILLYVGHLESTFFLSEFSREAQKEIKEMLLTLALESEVHGRIFEATIKKIQGSEQNVH